MKKFLKITGILILIFAMAAGGVILYYIYNPKKALLLVLPDLNEINFVHFDLRKDSVIIKLHVIIQNKMPYKMVIDTIHFDVKMENKMLTKATLPLHVNLLSNEIDTIELPIKVSLVEVQKITSDLKGQDSTYLDAGFYVVYNTLFGVQKLDYSKRIKISFPVFPIIKVVKVDRGKYNNKTKSSDAIIKIEIINKGTLLDLELHNIIYNLTIKNTLSTQGVYEKTVIVNPSSSVFIDVPVNIKYVNPLKTAWSIVTNKDISYYKLNIKTSVKLNNLKTAKEIPMEVDASGKVELLK